MARYIGLIDGAEGADALRLWVEVTDETGAVIPVPRSLAALKDDPDVAESLQDGATLATNPLFRSRSQ